MENLIEYKRFTDIETVAEITEILDKNKIPYEVIDKSRGFTLVATDMNPYDQQIILKIKKTDFNRVEKLFDSIAKKEAINSDEDHYLYTFSDKDIIDVIANQDEWTRLEVNIAQKIAKQRRLDISFDTLKRAKKQENTQPKNKVTYDKIAGWYLSIALFSIGDSLFSIFNVNFHLPGLTIINFFIAIFDKVFGRRIILDLATSLIFSSFFILFWYFSKRKIRLIYIVGFIFYLFDSLLSFSTRNWLIIGFHLFVLFLLTAGLSKKNVA